MTDFISINNGNYPNSNSVAVLGTASPSDMGQIFSYNGNSVRMRKMNGYILVCLTDFAKPFPDKNLSHIVNSRELTDYVARMSEIQNCISTDLLQVTRGGLIIALKNQSKSLAIYKIICIFAVLQLIINYASGIFYALKATILKYRQAISVYYRPMAIIGCSRLGYLPAFLFNL